MWNKRKIIMLPCSGEGILNCIFLNHHEYLEPNMNTFTRTCYRKQHLYILSNEEIKEGDWYYQFLEGNQTIHQADKSSIFAIDKFSSISHFAKKIIATTDVSLKIRNYKFDYNEDGIPKDSLNWLPLPQIPQSFISLFIEEYNKGNVIIEVKVEYYNLGFDISAEHIYHSNKLKINPDNTINIKIVKDIVYTRADIIHAFTSGHNKAKMGMTHSNALIQYKQEQNI